MSLETMINDWEGEGEKTPLIMFDFRQSSNKNQSSNKINKQAGR